MQSKKNISQKNPLEDIKAIREKSVSRANYFTKDDRDRIYKILDPHWVDATQFMINTGLRKGELINLKWDSVSLVPGKESITVEGCDEWDTKTGR